MTDKPLPRSTERRFRQHIAATRAELAGVQLQLMDNEAPLADATGSELVIRKTALTAELRAWEDALRIVRGVQYCPTGAWKRMLLELVRRFPPPTIFSTTQIKTVAEEEGFGFRPTNMRTQMLNFIRYGLVDRVSSGHFRFSTTGTALIRAWDRTPDSSEDAGDAGA